VASEAGEIARLNSIGTVTIVGSDLVLYVATNLDFTDDPKHATFCDNELCQLRQ